MPQKIVVHADDMVKAAEREIETLEVADAISSTAEMTWCLSTYAIFASSRATGGYRARSTALAACWNSGLTP
jgi:hypothetical protein